jgi:hypothetical protein
MKILTQTHPKLRAWGAWDNIIGFHGDGGDSSGDLGDFCPVIAPALLWCSPSGLDHVPSLEAGNAEHGHVPRPGNFVPERGTGTTGNGVPKSHGTPIRGCRDIDTDRRRIKSMKKDKIRFLDIPS